MEPEKTSTAGQVMGIIGIVLGIISLIVAFIPCVGVVAFIPAGLALIFSIISIVQASQGFGSKGLGIGALVISLVAILIAALWLVVFSNASMFANKLIKNSDNFDNIGKEFEKTFKDEIDKSIDMKAVSDSLENALRDLEDEMDKANGTVNEETANKAAKAAAKAIIKATEGIKAKKDTTKNRN